MRFREFKRVVREQADAYFRRLERTIPEHEFDGYAFPKYIFFSETEDHYYYEFAGMASRPCSLIAKDRSADSVTELLDPFSRRPQDAISSTAALTIEACSGMTFQGFAFSQAENRDVISLRFPIFDHFKSSGIFDPGANFSVSVDRDCDRLGFQDCLNVALVEGIARCRYIQCSQIFKKDTASDELRKWGVDKDLQHWGVKNGVVGSKGSAQNALLACQLLSLALSSGVHETTIGSFLSQHSVFLKKALGCTAVIYEPSLSWKEHDGPVAEDAINPDFMVQRQDGNFDIVEFKLPLTNRKSVTRGERNRRRFGDSATEGIAQLVNYREYFRFKANRDHAFEKYQMVVDNPNIYLVIGNEENFDPVEVAEAQRVHNFANLFIISYDVLAMSILKQA